MSAPASPAAEPGPPRRQIYHQGILDGACFLYSLANAYKALTGNRVTRQAWDRAIAQIPEPGTFLTGVGATQLDYGDAVSLIQLTLGALSGSDEEFGIDQLDEAARIPDFCAAITASSVVLFAFSGRTEFLHRTSHIVCGVAASANPQRLHVACSDAFSSRHLAEGTYSERRDPVLGRYSNDAILEDSPVEIAPRWRWRITVKPTAPLSP